MNDQHLVADKQHANSADMFHDLVFMEDLRNQMFKFAQLQVRDKQLAEDAVQEAILSAYQNIAMLITENIYNNLILELKDQFVDYYFESYEDININLIPKADLI